MKFNKILVFKISVLLMLGIIGYLGWRALQNNNTSSKIAGENKIDTKYVNFAGGYLFSIPEKYKIDDTIINGVTTVYPETLTLAVGKSLESMIQEGAVAIQVISALKDNNPKNFKEYVNRTLADDIRNSVKSNVDVREAKQGRTEALKVFAFSKDGKRLRVVYALNISRPIIMVAKDESDALKIIGSTTEELKDSSHKIDIDNVTRDTKTIVEMLQKKDTEGALNKATADFKKTYSEDKLTGDLKTSASYLGRAILIMGGSYNGQDFIAQLLFQPSSQNETPVAGVVSLHKDGNNWRLSGIQLPK